MVRYTQTHKLRGSSYLKDPALSAPAKGLLTILDLDKQEGWNADELDGILPLQRPAADPYLDELVVLGYLMREEE